MILRLINGPLIFKQALLLVLIAVCVALSEVGLAWSAPAWIAPILMLRYIDLHGSLRAQGLLVLVVSTAIGLSCRGVIPIPDPGYFIFTLMVGVFTWLPFWLNHIARPHVPAIARTLLLPMLWVALEWLNVSLSPYYSFGARAYTQTEMMPLLQIASYTGVYGITFLLGWFATCVNAFIANNDRQVVLRQLSICALVISMVFIFGAYRQWSLDKPVGTSVRLAGVTSMAITDDEIPDIVANTSSARTQQILAQLYDDLFEMSRNEAVAGAKIIAWPEANAIVEAKDEIKLISRGAEFARAYELYLFMSLVVLEEGAEKAVNKTVVVDPDGVVAYEYVKARPVPGEPVVDGDDDQLPVIDTPYGRLSSVICFDLDSPAAIRKLAAVGVDLLIVPAADWDEVAEYHHRMAQVRAIENGFSILRVSRNGVSSAINASGRELAYTRAGKASSTVTAQLSLSRQPTVYSLIGDIFALMNLIGLGFVFTAVLRARVSA